MIKIEDGQLGRLIGFLDMLIDSDTVLTEGQKMTLVGHIEYLESLLNEEKK